MTIREFADCRHVIAALGNGIVEKTEIGRLGSSETKNGVVPDSRPGTTGSNEPCATARVAEGKKPMVTESSEPCATARVVREKETGVMVSREPCVTARVVEVENRPATAVNKGDRVEEASPPALPQDGEELELDTDSSKEKKLHVIWRQASSEEGSPTVSEGDYERHTHHEAVLVLSLEEWDLQDLEEEENQAMLHQTDC